jgi:hypothetical protein
VLFVRQGISGATDTVDGLACGPGWCSNTAYSYVTFVSWDEAADPHRVGAQ